MADRFFIAPYEQNSGLQNNYRPWLIPDQAFSQLNNAYVFRGRVRKRVGSRWLTDDPLGTRFRVQVGTLGAPTSPVPAGSGAIGQMFSVGPDIFTVVIANGAMLSTNPLANGTFNTATGAFTIVDPSQLAATPIYWYPSFPVMGLLTYEQADINNEKIIGFDTKYAYEFTTNGWSRLAGEITPGAATWTGSNSQFFWGTTWTGVNAYDRIFFVTNFNVNEPNFMRIFDGANWDNFRPQIDSTPNYLLSARILVPFKNRLVAFNTWEGPNIAGAQNYPNRARYSQVGSPLDVNAWRQDIPGRGNAIDCPTTEQIITVEFIKDRLIVYFERSTWEFVYTSNQAYPFAWQQINTELGAESTFSVVPFDKVALGVGNVGIMACNGANVERIDQKIPDEVFKIHNLDAGVNRVYGIRDYFTQLVYWTFPSDTANATFPFPNRILVYNYLNDTWAFNDDSITAFGYFQPQTSVTWDSTTVTWNDDEPWDSGSTQALFRQVVAGNQEGYTFIVDSEVTTNASVLQITNISVVTVNTNNQLTFTVINHNLRLGDFIFIENIVDNTGNLNFLNGKILKVANDPITAATPNTFIANYDDGVTIIAGTYAGGGILSRVSNIAITTKEYNFYADKGVNARINKIDFLVDRTGIQFNDGTNDGGSIQVNFFDSTSATNMTDEGIITNTIMGTGTLDTFAYNLTYGYEANASRLWHPVFVFAEGEVVAFQLTMNDSQMTNTTIREADFQLHALCIHANPASSRLQ